MSDGRTGEKYLIETLGSGALFFDFDLDGTLDLYIVNATYIPPPVDAKHSRGHLPENKLYQNNGDGTSPTSRRRQVSEIPAMVSDAPLQILITMVTPKST